MESSATFDRKLEDIFFFDIGSFIYVRIIIIKGTSDLYSNCLYKKKIECMENIFFFDLIIIAK